MTITRKNFDILKQAVFINVKVHPAAVKAIQETEKAAADHNKRMSAYILEKRKENKNYCR
ncbi:MAG: hypothetical protein J5372_00785 [Lachnospiraceae bacterium]|nr:hypothetical protein [Lachnospiraceae bacterium]